MQKFVNISGTADPERGDRGAAVAVERGAQGDAGLDQFAGVAQGRRLGRWAEVSERRVRGGERRQGGPHGGVDDSQDGEFRRAAQVADEWRRPRW